MPFTIQPHRHSPVQVPISYSSGPFHGFGTVWTFSLTGYRLSVDLSMREGEILSLSVTIPNKHRIKVTEATVRRSSDNEFAIETTKIQKRTKSRLLH